MITGMFMKFFARGNFLANSGDVWYIHTRRYILHFYISYVYIEGSISHEYTYNGTRQKIIWSPRPV